MVGIVVQGSIPGTVISGATLTKGVVGQALKLDGISQYVDYGTHFDECFHMPDLCTDGVTFSFWVAMHSVGIIFTTGNHVNTMGFYAAYIGGKLMLNTLNSTTWDRYVISDWPINQWRHVVLTWSSADGLVLYINGCNADPGKSSGFAFTASRTMPNNLRFNIRIGKPPPPFNIFAAMTLDEFLVWHEILSPKHVWQLYVQGGAVQT